MYVRTYVCCTSTYLELGDEDVGDAAEHRDEIERVPRLPEVVLNKPEERQCDAVGVVTILCFTNIIPIALKHVHVNLRDFFHHYRTSMVTQDPNSCILHIVQSAHVLVQSADVL